MLAAARAFSRAGYAGATMQDIAREAGFTAASLYTYFPGKREIFQSLLDMLYAEFDEVASREMPKGLTFEQMMELQLRDQFELIERRRDVFSMFFTLWPGRNHNLPIEGRACAHPFEARIHMAARWLSAHATKEHLQGRKPDDLARFMVGAVFALVHGWAQEGMKVPLTDHVAAAMDFLLFGISGRPAGGRRK